MAFHERAEPVALGYIGDEGPVSDAIDAALSDDEGYRTVDVSVDDDASRLDGFLVDTDSLDGSGADLLARLDGDRPVVAVGSDDTVTVSAGALPLVDAHVSPTRDGDEFLELLDSLFDERWRNLGMTADGLLDAIFASVPVHLYVKDSEGRHVRSSGYYEDPENQIGRTDTEIIDAPAFARQTYEDDLHVLSSGEPLIDEVEYNPDDGDWGLTSKVPMYDGDDIVGLLGATRRITQRKEYEKRLERQKARLQEFASIISHDLRNPLTVAEGRIALAREDYPDDENLRTADSNLRRMDDLIDEVLTMTRQGMEVEETDVVALRSIATASWESVATGEATLTVDGSLRFEADSGRLRHVFENAFRNAVEHGARRASGRDTPGDAVEHGSPSPASDPQRDAAGQPASDEPSVTDAPEDAGERGGPGVSVTVGVLDDARPEVVESGGGPASGFYVADDGPGIPESARESVFDRGYTTSEESTGLGLEIVRQIVEAHGWSITVSESAAGGARFEISGVESVE